MRTRFGTSCDHAQPQGLSQPFGSTISTAGAIVARRLMETRACDVWAALSLIPMDLTLVPPAGFEPAHMASEANALSPELRERLLAHRNPVVPGNCHGAS